MEPGTHIRFKRNHSSTGKLLAGTKHSAGALLLEVKLSGGEVHWVPASALEPDPIAKHLLRRNPPALRNEHNSASTQSDYSEESAATFAPKTSFLAILLIFSLLGVLVGAILGWASVPEVTMSNQYAITNLDNVARDHQQLLFDYILSGSYFGILGGCILAICVKFIPGKRLISFLKFSARSWRLKSSRKEIDFILYDLLKRGAGSAQVKLYLSSERKFCVHGLLDQVNRDMVSLKNDEGIHYVPKEFIVSISVLDINLKSIS